MNPPCPSLAVSIQGKRAALALLGCTLLAASSTQAAKHKTDSAAPESTPAQTAQSPAAPAAPSATPTALEVPSLTFSKTPTDPEIMAARIFLEPLVPMGKSSAKENADLAAALLAWKAAKSPEDLTALTQFLQKYPKSAWKASLEVNLGQLKYEEGYLSEALALWEDAWNTAKGETALAKKAVADAALGNLLLLDARLGRVEELNKYFAEISGRHLSGSTEQKVDAAHQGLMRMTHSPQIAFKCGPYAIDMLAYLGKKVVGRSDLIEAAKSTSEGTNLAQVKQWSDQLGLHYQMAKRSPGAPFLIPAVMHWKLGHFAAITEEHNGKYHIIDPTFGETGQFWVTPEALEAETDGYFLVPEGPLPKGWQAIDEAEGKTVWGKGGADSRNGDWTTIHTPLQTPGGPCSQGGMAVSSVYSMQATLTIRDTPLWYVAPFGPAMQFGLDYNYLQTNQPATFTFTNFTTNWSFSWLSYLTVDASRNVTVRLRGGGSEVYNYALPDNNGNAYAPDLYSHAVLVLTVAGTYERRLPDGSVEVFSKADGTGRIFLTAVKDPQGNAATLTYDGNFRITSITDAVGKVTNLTYVSNTFGNAGYYLVSVIADPYGRSASFTYDSADTMLLSITDSIGITSQFSYDTGSFIVSLTTPYGKTLFYQYIPPNDPAQTSRGLKFTLPDGSSSVCENWLGPAGETKSTYYWDRHAMQLYPNDAGSGIYTHCKLVYWLVKPIAAELQPIPGYVKEPLENQVTYTYPDQSQPYYLGSSSQPSQISRIMDDASVQTYQYQYNAAGNLTKSIDPVGRTFSYSYAANNIDLLEARQTRGGNNDLLGKWEYNNAQHFPNVAINGSGQQTQYAYNGNGQRTSIVDAYSNTTTFVYTGSTGQLSEIDASSALPNAKTTFTYDNGTSAGVTTAGMPKTISIATSATTNYTLTYAYDAANRPTMTTYPDGTYDQVIYTYLDPTLGRDRLGHWSQQSFDSLRQKASMTDALGRTTKFTWCTCGAMSSLTDANGNQTSWAMDLEGRITSKTYTDSTVVSYVYENSMSRLKSTTDALNQTKNYTYNLDNSPAQVSYTNAVHATSPVNFTYDPNYRRVSTGSNGWGQVGYGYNAYITDPYGTPTTGAGMVQTATNNVIANSAITYTYDNLGRTINRSINGGSNSSTWVYDAISRVTSSTNVLGSFTNTYLNSTYGLSQLSSVAYPNGQTTAYTWYDNSGDMRLQEIKNTVVGSGTLSQFDYGYDAVGNITSWTQVQQGASTAAFANSYDFANQLTGAVSTVSGTTANQYYYNYDPAANRISEQINANVTKGSFNNVNQLTALDAGGATRFSGTISKPGTVTVGTNAAFMNWSQQFTANPSLTAGTNTIAIVAKDGSAQTTTNTYHVVIPTVTSGTMAYDANGNMTSDGINNYQWDAENRLITIGYSGSGNSTQFTYDPLSRRAKIVETTGGSVTSTKQFVYRGSDMCEERDGSGAVTKQYFGSGMRMSGTNYFYTKDHLKSIREVVSGSATIQAQYAYDPYGRVTKQQGAMDADFQYGGAYMHARSGLNLTMFRAYNPNLGRWISRDPLRNAELREGINLYYYVENNPTDYIDPLGLADHGGAFNWPPMSNGVVENYGNCPIYAYDYDGNNWYVLQPGERSPYSVDIDYTLQGGTLTKIEPYPFMGGGRTVPPGSDEYNAVINPTRARTSTNTFPGIPMTSPYQSPY